jgi:glyoxylase-like metal-dependent hydrolase (beta-lactamase superfamily II)
MAIDYGYNWERLRLQSQAAPSRRRALLHGLGELKSRFGIDHFDMVLVSHFHDDHVCGIPTLQRLHGTECWASEAFADLLEHPEAHCFPCTWPEPIRVDRRIRLDETVQWEEYTFHFGAMSGHTRFAALIGFEADGRRFAHTGDQYFFADFARTDDFTDNPVIANYVYRNGARLDGYRQSEAWMLDWRPDIVLTGHTNALHTDDAYFDALSAFSARYESVHRAAMQLADDAPHFDIDSWGGWLWPYRLARPDVGPVTVTATLRNPLPTAATLVVRLVGPAGWDGDSATTTAPPRAEVRVDLTIRPTGPCRRQPIAVSLTVNGQPHGQVADALVTLGHPQF